MKEREEGVRVAWHLHRYLLSEVGSRTCPFNLIWNFLLWRNAQRRPRRYRNLLSTSRVKIAFPILPRLAVRVVRSGSFFALVQHQRYAALGAAGHRLPNKQAFVFLILVRFMVHKGEMKPAGDLQIFAVQFSTFVNIFDLYFSAFLMAQLCFFMSVIPKRPGSCR